ncbi:type IV secretion system protein [Comamonas sp. w2-DMI]|uniref:type IV secretion system protein n=1 Tax=Comamonas sp. w2-DMI TaxID=3126391 RepID=UPI0032E44229
MCKVNRLIRLLSFVCVILLSGFNVFAQSSLDGTEAVATSSSEKKPQATYPGAALIQQVISEIVQAVVKGFDDLANNAGFDDVGQTIMYMLMAVMLAWASVRSMFGAGINAFLEEAISLLLVMGIIQLLLWSGGIDGIEKFINSIATNIAGDDLSNLSSTLESSLKRTFKACLDILTMPSIESNSGWNVAQVLVAIPQTILQVFAKFISAAFVVLSCAIFVANVVLAYGSLIIAKALAPIMIPWLLLPSASFLFDGWLKFFFRGMHVQSHWCILHKAD